MKSYSEVRNAYNQASFFYFVAIFFSLLNSLGLTSFIYFLAKILAIYFFDINSSLQNYFIYSLISVFISIFSLFITNIISEHASLKSSAKLKKTILTSLFYERIFNKPSSSEVINYLEEIDNKAKPFFKIYYTSKAMLLLIPCYILLLVFFTNKISFFILLFCIIFIPIILFLLGIYTKNKSKLQLKALAELSNQYLDSIRGLEILKLFNQSNVYQYKLNKANEDYRDKTIGILKIAFINTFVLDFFTTVSTALIAVQLGFEMILGRTQLNDSLFVLMIVPSFFLVFKQYSSAFHTSKEAIILFDELFIKKKKNDFKEQLTDNKIETIIQKLEIQNFSIKYQNQIKIIDDINLIIKRGDIVLLKGQSGYGKTSLLNGIAGLLPYNGKLLINNKKVINIKNYCSYLMQNSYYFKTSIQNNITLGDKIETAKLNQLIEDFGLEKTIAIKQNSLKHLLNYNKEGLSGGELRRIAIIRALVIDKPIYLLDEPTEHLDEKNIAKLEKVLIKYKRQGKIIILSSHSNLLDDLVNTKLEFKQGVIDVKYT